MIWVVFQSDLTPEVLAQLLSEVIYEGPPPEGIPYKDLDEGWYELSRGNDHKLSSRGEGFFAYRDRYGEPNRMQRVRDALMKAGCVLTRQE